MQIFIKGLDGKTSTLDVQPFVEHSFCPIDSYVEVASFPVDRRGFGE
jgi:hypothetical protein